MVREVHMSWDSDNPIPDELERASWDLDDSTLIGPDGIDDVVNDRRKKTATWRKKKRNIEEKDHGLKKDETV